jgi:hypothetical protein
MVQCHLCLQCQWDLVADWRKTWRGFCYMELSYFKIIKQ